MLNLRGNFSPHYYCKLTVITCQAVTFNFIKVIYILFNSGLWHANKVVSFEIIKFIRENQRF